MSEPRIGVPGRSADQTNWLAFADACRDARGHIDQTEFTGQLLDLASTDYTSDFPSTQLVEFEHGPATYVLDSGGGPQAERTVLAVARPEPPEQSRDGAYQHGYPLPDRLGGRPVDRGHFIPYTAGGLFGPNLFVQDRALNRGWSSDGRLYRELERSAVAAAPKSMLFVRPLYADDSDIPELLDLGVVAGPKLDVRRFRNRFDHLSPVDQDVLAIHLQAAMDSQIGALGEETAAVMLEDVWDAVMVGMGDSGLAREAGRQELDLLAIVDGELIAYEVKTRFMSRVAGRLTRAGNLARPRLRRPGTPTGDRQGSQAYVAARLSAYVDTDMDFEGIDVRLIAVDLRSMLAQQFTVNDAGTRLARLGPPVDCSAAALQALRQIIAHRGYL
jgi:hypothetical protein